MAVEQKLVAPESLLESRAHEGITRTRVREESQVDPEDGEV